MYIHILETDCLWSEALISIRSAPRNDMKFLFAPFQNEFHSICSRESKIFNGCFAVSVSRDRTLKIWDLEAGQSLASFETHAPLWCCAIVQKGQTLLAGDHVGGLHILEWRNASPKLIES